MRRRTMLKLAGGAGLAGISVGGGYVAVTDRDSCNASESGHRWCYGVKGTLEAVSQGRVFVRERTAGATRGSDGLFESGPTANGEIVALDAETGEIRWTYGQAVGMDSYTDLVVSDGVYFGYCTDEIGNCRDLTALELDGEKRWTRDVTPSPFGPLLADGVVYDAAYSGPVRAHDTETGETLWEREVEGRATSLSSVDDRAVYVEADAETGGSFVSIDRDDGSIRWRYEPAGDQGVTGSAVADGIAYVVTFDQVVAVDGGDELWRLNFEESDGWPEIEGIASGRLFLLAEPERTEDGRPVFRLEVVDLATGERDWTSESIEHPNPEYGPQVVVRGETVYVSTGQLRALDATTGDERWSASLDSGPIQSVSVVEEGTTEDHAVFVHGDDRRLASFAPDGTRTWEGSVPTEIRNYLVSDSVFVETDEGIYALERQVNP